MRGFFSKLKIVDVFVFLDAAIENLLPQIGENSEIHALLEGHNFSLFIISVPMFWTVSVADGKVLQQWRNTESMPSQKVYKI